MDTYEPLNPGEVWETNTYSNNLYKIMSDEGKCLGTFIPSEEAAKVSDITGLPEATLDDYITGTVGCSIPQYSEAYGVGTIFKGELIKNNTPNKVYIYALDKEGKKVEPGHLLETNKTLSVNAMTNSLFQITDMNKKCLGILFPTDKLQFVSELSVLKRATIDNYTTGKDACNSNQRSGEYGESLPVSGTVIKNDTNDRITVQWIDESGNVDEDGVVLMPGDDWNVSTKDNYLYKLANDNKECIGVFLPKENTIQKVSEVSSISSPTLSDFIVGTGGCAVKHVSKMYGVSDPISGPILINDTNKALKIYLVKEDGTEEFTESENSIETFDVLLPGETLEKETKSNNLFKIKTETGECLGTFVPTKELIKVSTITGLPADKQTSGIPDQKLVNLDEQSIVEEKKEGLSMTVIIIILVVICAIIVSYLFMSGFIKFGGEINVYSVENYDE